MYYLCNGFIYCPVGTQPAAANVASAKREGMKKLVCLFLLLPLLARAGGQTPEVTESDKKGSEFVSNIQVTLNATYEQACLTLDKFVRQYKYSLDSLFQWALRGMKLKGEKDDMISINLKTHTCAEGSDHVDGVMDLYVSILRQDFHDTTYDVTLTREEESDGTLAVYYDLSRCDKVIDHARARLAVTRNSDNTSCLTLDSRFKATLPYNLMSKKQYRDNIEWRLVQLVSNLRDEAEYPPAPLKGES